jgi:hypothetical protein
MLARGRHWRMRNDGPSPSPGWGYFFISNEKPGFWPGESKTFRT